MLNVVPNVNSWHGSHFTLITNIHHCSFTYTTKCRVMKSSSFDNFVSIMNWFWLCSNVATCTTNVFWRTWHLDEAITSIQSNDFQTETETPAKSLLSMWHWNCLMVDREWVKHVPWRHIQVYRFVTIPIFDQTTSWHQGLVCSSLLGCTHVSPLKRTYSHDKKKYTIV